MIKFFRHIRQNLIMENKTSKYLKYAIGEIVLVVIGILIALQVNNWNEVRKLKIEEQNTLRKLQRESEMIVDYLTLMCNSYDNYLTEIEASAKALHDKSLGNLSEQDFVSGVFSSAFYEAISPPKSTYNELNSTGKIQHIESEIIKKSISDYYSHLEYINTQLVYFRNQYTKPVDAAGEDFLYTYDELSPFNKLKAVINFDALSSNKLFISKHAKALRDQIVFNKDRKELLYKAILMCEEISKELGKECHLEKKSNHD